MAKKIILTFLLFILTSLFISDAYAYWSTLSIPEQQNINGNISIGTFGDWGEDIEADVIIDDIFYETYMVQDASGTWDWKRQENTDPVYATEIKALTPIGTFIYRDGLIFYVTATTYNFIDNGLPNLQNPQSWALMPITINFLTGWSYLTNQVIHAQNDEFFMAKYYTTVDPLVNRSTWDKIEPVTDNNFNKIGTSNHINYASPIMETIQRSYIWDLYTTYRTGDIVTYNNQIWRANSGSTNVTPTTSHSWAWVQI